MKNIINQDTQIKQILNKSPMDQPSDDFTGNIMSRIALSPLKSKIKEEPIFTKKFWFAVSVAFSMMIVIISAVILLIPNKPTVETQRLNLLTSLIDNLRHSVTISESFMVIPIITLSILILMFFDNFLKKTFHTK